MQLHFLRGGGRGGEEGREEVEKEQGEEEEVTSLVKDTDSEAQVLS